MQVDLPSKRTAVLRTMPSALNSTWSTVDPIKGMKSAQMAAVGFEPTPNSTWSTPSRGGNYTNDSGKVRIHALANYGLNVAP